MDQLTIPSRLYGRDHDIITLLESFDRISSGHGEVLLAPGSSGVGKDSTFYFTIPYRDEPEETTVIKNVLRNKKMEQQNTNSKERALLPEGDDRIQAEEKNIPSKKISHFIYNGSSAYLSLILISSIFVGETLVELFIDTLPPFSQLGTALLDSTLLIVPVFPILYFFVFRPLTIHITERKQTEVALKNSMSLTDATFESIHNAILVVSDQGTVIKTNAKFAEMWRIPDNIIASGDDKTLMDSVLGQLADPDGFIAKVLELYEKPEAESLDLIDLKDGRIFERISKPIYLGGEPKGRVWSFLNITKRKQAEETLVQEQYLMRTLMDNLPDHIYFKDHESRFIRINKAHAQMFGLSDPMHAVGKTDFDFFTEEHAQQAYEDEQTIIRTGQMLSIEEKETQHDRPNTWVSTIKLPLRDKEGNIIGTFGISRDITERKQVEKALQKSEERYRTLIENMGEGVGFLNSEETFEFANPVAEKIFGVGKGKLLGLCLYDFLPEINHKVIESQTQQRIQGKSSVYEHEIVLKDGSKKDILITATPCFDNKKFIGTFGIFRDITDRKQIEEALRISEERLELFFSQSLDGFFFMMLDEPVYWNDTIDREKVIDYAFAHQRITKINDAMLKQYLAETKQFVGLTPNDLYAFDIKYGKRVWREFFDQGQLHIETKEQRFDNSQMWVEGDYICLYDAEKRIIGHFGIQRDVTERKQAEEEIKFKNEELQKINAEKDKFFSIIAHDLRSPFNGFLGLTQIMVQELPDLTSDEIQKIAVSMRDSATNLFRLLENLLEWARMQQGLIPFDPKIVELLPIVDECISIMLEPAKNKGIELSYDIPVDIAVFADSNLLQTVIRNLVSNALKFTPKGGKVSLSAKATNDNSVEISIKDSGIGMNQTMVNNLFRLDVKTNRLGTEGEPSSGLGLLLCKEFIEKHGGKLWVESEDGKGSTFYFTIPCKTENEAKTVI